MGQSIAGYRRLWIYFLIYKKVTSNVVVVESVTRTREYGLVFENVAREFFSAVNTTTATENSGRRSFPLYACRVMLSNGERGKQENLASGYVGYFYRTAFTNGLVSCSAIFSGPPDGYSRTLFLCRSNYEVKIYLLRARRVFRVAKANCIVEIMYIFFV